MKAIIDRGDIGINWDEKEVSFKSLKGCSSSEFLMFCGEFNSSDGQSSVL